MSKEPEIIATEVTPLDEGNNNTIVGRWKSGLCSCFKYGCCHPALCCACFFPIILMAQLLTRMKLTWLGAPSSPSKEYKKTFLIVLTLSIINYIIYSIFYCPLEVVKVNGYNGENVVVVPNEDCSVWQHYFSTTCSTLWGLYTFFVLVRLRYAIRTKYHIPGDGCEDCFCIFWCSWCSSVQMAHQTADYEQQAAYCCNTTGLPPIIDDDNDEMIKAYVV